MVETQTSDPSTGSAIGNHLNITGGNLSGYGCTIYGGFSRGGDTENNTVTISGGTIHASNIYGGQTIASGKKANGNVVTIDGGTVTVGGGIYNGIYGGSASSLGGNDTEASGNTVTIEKDATLLGSETRIYGGYARKG